MAEEIKQEQKVGILESENGKFFFMKDLFINLNLKSVEYRNACYPKFTNLVMVNYIQDKQYALIINYRKQIIGTILVKKEGFTASDLNTIEKFCKDVNIPVIRK